jgi:uncharacterized membrane protein YgaE (UPF0421/DUF939 family)
MKRFRRHTASRAVQAGRSSIEEAFGRLVLGASPMLQTAGAAAVAYTVAFYVLGHDAPFFAPMSAVIALGASRGRHLRRAVEMVFGIAMGITIADSIVLAIGTGPLQIALICVLAMSGALLLGGGSMLVTQAALSGILVATIENPAGALVPDRFFDGLVGGGVALLFSHLLFPLNPMSIVARASAPVFDQLGTALDEVAEALAAGDSERAFNALLQARAIDEDVRRFNDALVVGYETVRLAPPRRKARNQLEIYAIAASQVDHAVRNTRVLARACVRLLRRSGPEAEQLSHAVHALAHAVRSLNTQLEAPGVIGETRRLALIAAGRATAVMSDPDVFALGSVVGQVRSTAHDILRASGMSAAQVQDALDEVTGMPDAPVPDSGRPEGTDDA